jgi:malate dehydrogenase (oxaloacetate-decarboxylating)
VTALDVNSGNRGKLRVDVTCAATDTAHAESLVAAMAEVPGVTVHKVSDRTFLMHLGGKIEMRSKVPLRNRDDLSMAYTPGVARVSLALAAKPEDARRLTIKRNSVAVVTDGSAVLGLGNVGPYAALPVMEGKAALFAETVGINGVPILLNEREPARVCQAVLAIESSFGAIQLEDFAAPECFEIEQTLRARLAKPVLHDDQHGTAVVALAALINAARCSGHDLRASTVGQVGLGAAGTGIVRLLRAYGVQHILGADRSAAAIARLQALGGEAVALQTLMRRADVVIATTGVKGLIRADWVRPGQVILALSNPDPEIEPLIAREHGAAFAADGKGINNVLAFPGLFKGALEANAPGFSDAMLMAAAETIAALAQADALVPDPLDKEVHGAVAAAVRAAASVGMVKP